MGMFSIRGSPFPYGDYHTEMGGETRIFPYGESPFSNRWGLTYQLKCEICDVYDIFTPITYEPKIVHKTMI